MTRRLPGIAFVAATTLVLAACGGSDSPEAEGSASGKAKAREISDAERRSEPAPPADFVRWECAECSCRVFTGDGGYCSRPSCKHHWKSHQRPPQE